MNKVKNQPAVTPVGTYPKVNMVELSCSADENKLNNASWENILPKPINVLDINQLAIKTGFINDSQLSGSNIEILEDTIVALEFGYYIINGVQFCKYSGVNDMQYYFIPQWVGAPNGPGQPTDINLLDGAQVPIVTDGKLYVWHQSDPSRPSGYSPVSGRVELDLKAGSYTPQQIANVITNKLSSVNNKDLQGDSIPGGVPNIDQLNSGSQLYRNATTDTLVNEGFFLDSYTNSVWDPAVVRRFRYVAQAQGGAPLAPSDSYSPTFFVGTDQIALDYDDVSETFQWSFIHKPTTDPDNNGEISNVLYRSTMALPLGAEYVGPLKTQSKMTGIFFTKLEPANFWESLGFDINSITVNISDGVNVDEVRNKTTDNQIGLSTISLRSPAGNSMIVNQTYTDPRPLPIQSLLTFTAENNIVPLKASRTYKASNSPFYLISLEFGPSNNYSDADKVYNHIFAVVGKYFQANDFVMITGDSSIPHIHQGAGYMISSFKVKILDKNKNLVRNLGPNSTIFLELIQ